MNKIERIKIEKDHLDQIRQSALVLRYNHSTEDNNPYLYNSKILGKIERLVTEYKREK